MRAVNLIPADQREGAGSLTGHSGGAALIVVALIAGVAVLAVMYGKARHTESSSRTELATVNAELAASRAQIGRFAPYTAFIAMANQRVQTLSGLVASRFDWSHAFNELGRVLPHDATLTSLHGQVGSGTGGGSGSSSAPTPTAGPTPVAGATPASATPPGSTPVFTLTGCTTSQSEVAQTLQRLRLIDSVADVTLQSSTKSSPSGSGSSGAGASGAASSGCPPASATFSAQVTFVALPSAPPTNSPGSSTGAAGAGSAGGSAVPASSQGASR